jgi:phosphopantetheinyl transferase (holo-ACP synthase)
MKRKDIIGHIEALNGVSEIKGVKFAYTVLKNKKKFEKQIEEDKEIFQKVLTPSEDYKTYETKRIELCELHSIKDAEGKAVVENDKYKLIDEKVFTVDLEKLNTEFNDSLVERKQQITEYTQLMEEVVNIEFIKLNLEDLPTDLTEKELESIEFMINLD